MLILKDIPALRDWRARRHRVALVPTMGNLHAGHIHLIETAKQHAEEVIASIFVNPLQFGAGEDLDKYPRTFAEDCQKLSDAGTSAVFAPTEPVLYPVVQQYFVDPPALAEQWCGAVRSGHFRGVTTVVAKLFNLVQPQVALFGKKDYQQLALIRGMTQQLNFPIEIVGCETQRAPDGLALSSRNGYLTAAERQEAPYLYSVLKQLGARIEQGSRDYRELERAAVAELEAHGWKPDYLAVCAQDTLAPLIGGGLESSVVILVAARLGTTRLIDNLEVCAA